MHVEAAQTSFSKSATVSYVNDAVWISSNASGDTLTAKWGSSGTIDVPITITWSGTTYTYNKVRLAEMTMTGLSDVKYWYLTDAEGDIVYTSTQDVNTTAYTALSNSKYNIGGLQCPYIIHFYISNTETSSSYITNSFTFTFSGNITVVEGENPNTIDGTVSTNDSTANDHLDSIEDSSSSTAESSAAIAESVTSTTGTGLLATIKNFFGSFFTNIINSFKSLFIPDDDYFSDWFNNLNDLLSDKLGMLYSPFDFLITVLESVYDADTTESSIPFPEIAWDDTVLVESQSITFSDLLGDNFDTIQGYVYFATDVVLLFAFLYLLQRKVALILTGSEVNG